MIPRFSARLAVAACALLWAACGGGGGSGNGGGGPTGGGGPAVAPDVRLDADAPGAELSVFPRICCSDARAYVVWYDRRNGRTDVYANVSADGGATWAAADERLDTDPPGASGSSLPVACCAGTSVYVAFCDERGGPSQIRFNRSLDGGASWLADDVQLDRDDVAPATSREPSICCDGARVYVVWEDLRDGAGDVRFNRSLDGGATWLSQDVRLDTDAPGIGRSRVPRVACAGERVYVVWYDDRDGAFDIRFNRSLDGGTTWLASDVRLDTGDAPGAASSVLPRLAVDGDAIVVLWEDVRDGLADVRANRSLDAGTSWLAADVRVDSGDAPGASASTRVAVCRRGAEVFAVWQDGRSGWRDVRFDRSPDGGATWEVTDRRLGPLASPFSESLQPAVSCSATHVHVVWQNDADGAFDVFLDRSADSGTTWLAAPVRLDADAPGAADSAAPDVASVGAEARVVWFDERNGLPDVYFNRWGG